MNDFHAGGSCAFGTHKWSSSAYHGPCVPLYTLQLLKMHSGTCPAAGQKREEGSLPAASHCHCACGRAGEVPGNGDKPQSACRLEVGSGRWPPCGNSWAGGGGGGRQQRQALACPGALGLRPCLALHGLAPLTASVHPGWGAAVLVPSASHETQESSLLVGTDTRGRAALAAGCAREGAVLATLPCPWLVCGAAGHLFPNFTLCRLTM